MKFDFEAFVTANLYHILHGDFTVIVTLNKPISVKKILYVNERNIKDAHNISTRYLILENNVLMKAIKDLSNEDVYITSNDVELKIFESLACYSVDEDNITLTYTPSYCEFILFITPKTKEANEYFENLVYKVLAKEMIEENLE